MKSANIDKTIQVAAMLATEYDARRIRTQRAIIRDVLFAAAECGTWLTLKELESLTKIGAGSISANIRHLRKTENGGYMIEKRRREPIFPRTPGQDGRGLILWEYQISKG